jgi:hypothetical protein
MLTFLDGDSNKLMLLHRGTILVRIVCATGNVKCLFVC